MSEVLQPSASVQVLQSLNMCSDQYNRVIAIGDIHGCVHALNAILDDIRPARDDLVISLGDFVDTGRETRETIERLLQMRDECRLVVLRGNHEEMLLGALTSTRLRDSWLMCGGVATLNSYKFCGDIDCIPEGHTNSSKAGSTSLKRTLTFSCTPATLSICHPESSPTMS